MQVTICLNWPVDIDLIIARYHEGKSFQAVLCRCLRSVIYGTGYRYYFPKTKDLLPDEYRKNTKVTLTLDPKKDDALIRYISAFTAGFKGQAVKAAFRICSRHVPMDIISRSILMQENGAGKKEVSGQAVRRSRREAAEKNGNGKENSSAEKNKPDERPGKPEKANESVRAQENRSGSEEKNRDKNRPQSGNSTGNVQPERKDTGLSGSKSNVEKQTNPAKQTGNENRQEKDPSRKQKNREQDKNAARQETDRREADWKRTSADTGRQEPDKRKKPEMNRKDTPEPEKKKSEESARTIDPAPSRKDKDGNSRQGYREDASSREKKDLSLDLDGMDSEEDLMPTMDDAFSVFDVMSDIKPGE